MDYKLIELKNTSKCLLLKDVNSLAFNFKIYFKVGSRFEDESNNGVAHLIEHMFFKGTSKNPDPKKLSFKVENLGANINAWTSKEITSYYGSVPKDKSLELIEFFSELLFDSIFPQAELIKEKNVIIEEIKMYSDVPQYKVFDNFISKLFSNHSLGRNIAGSEDTLKDLNSKSCKEFIKRNYNNKNILIVLSGNFNEKEVISKLEDSFGNWEINNKPNINKYNARNIDRNEVFEEYKDNSQLNLVIGGYLYSYKEIREKEKYALALGKTIITGGFYSKLNQKFRDDLAIAYYAYLEMSQYFDTGYYAFELGVDRDNKDLAISEINLIIDDIIKGNITDDEYNRAINYLTGSIITQFDSSNDLSSLYASEILQEEKILTPNEMIKIIKNISKNDIIDIWKLVFQKNKLICTLGRN